MSIVIMVRLGIRGSCLLELEGNRFEKEGSHVKIANLDTDGYDSIIYPFQYFSVMTGYASTVQMKTVTVQLSAKIVEFSMKKLANAFAPRVGTESHVKDPAIIWKTLVGLVLAFPLG
jgi:hypothetical protein